MTDRRRSFEKFRSAKIQKLQVATIVCSKAGARSIIYSNNAIISISNTKSQIQMRGIVVLGSS